MAGKKGKIMKIVFMGTPDFAQKSLEAIYNAKHEIQAVVTNPDKPKGRGMKMISSPVKQFAESKKLKIYQPSKVRNNEEFINEIKSLNPDLLCVVAYGKILPKEILDIPKYGAINVHGSLLPKYRGSAPIQWAVINGDKKTGITTMFMDIGMDTGDMILKQEVEIGEDETTGELWNSLSEIGANLLVKTIEKIEQASKKINENENTLLQIKQLIGAKKQGDNYTMAPMLDKKMAQIDWNKSAREIHNLVRGLDPIMGTHTFYNGKKIKIWKTQIEKENSDNQKETKVENGQVTNVEKNKLTVKTGNGELNILEIQPENKKRMPIKDFLNGTHIKQGERLG